MAIHPHALDLHPFHHHQNPCTGKTPHQKGSFRVRNRKTRNGAPSRPAIVGRSGRGNRASVHTGVLRAIHQGNRVQTKRLPKVVQTRQPSVRVVLLLVFIFIRFSIAPVFFEEIHSEQLNHKRVQFCQHIFQIDDLYHASQV